MTRIIALTAVTALGLSGAPVHEPVHGRAPMSSRPVTVRNIVKSAQPTSVRVRDVELRTPMSAGAPRRIHAMPNIPGAA